MNGQFTLTDEACATFDPVFKMNPPLRSADRTRSAPSLTWVA